MDENLSAYKCFRCNKKEIDVEEIISHLCEYHGLRNKIDIFYCINDNKEICKENFSTVERLRIHSKLCRLRSISGKNYFICIISFYLLYSNIYSRKKDCVAYKWYVAT